MYFPPFPRKLSLCVPMSPSLGRRLEGLALSKPSVTAGPKETSTYEGRDLGRLVWERWEATQREAARPFRGRDPHSVAPVPSHGQRVLWEESFPTSCANTGSVCCTQRMISQTVQCGSCLSCGVTEKSCHLTSVPPSGFWFFCLSPQTVICSLPDKLPSCRTSLENLPEGPSGVAEKWVGCLLVCPQPCPRASCRLWAPLNTEKFRFGSSLACSQGGREGCWPLPSLQQVSFCSFSIRGFSERCCVSGSVQKALGPPRSSSSGFVSFLKV